MGFALTYTIGYYAAIATVYYLANGRYQEAACWAAVLAVACVIFYHNEKGQPRRY